MTNLAVIPIILPLAAGVILAFLHNRTKAREWVAHLFAVLLVLFKLVCCNERYHRLRNWGMESTIRDHQHHYACIGLYKSNTNNR